MMTKEELKSEFWMLTKGILQDENVDTEEGRVVLRWLEEHNDAGAFDFAIAKVREHLKDGWIDRFESKEICRVLGDVLRLLRTPAAT